MSEHVANMSEQGLYDIYGIWHVPFWQTKSFYAFVGFVCLLVLFFVARSIFKRLRAKKKLLPAWEIALQKLRELQAHNIATQERAKQFYGSLTVILKNYLHARYSFDAQGKTDKELLVYLRDVREHRFDNKLVNELEEIFSGMELIKFANVQAMQEQIEKDLARTIGFIKQTVPKTPKD